MLYVRANICPIHICRLLQYDHVPYLFIILILIIVNVKEDYHRHIQYPGIVYKVSRQLELAINILISNIDIKI